MVLLLLFLLRVFTKQGWYIVTYALGIYHLNLFIAFLTPKIDPELDLDNDEGPELPTHSSGSKGGEFKPFMRRLPEFKFWYAVTKSTVIGTVCTFFELFNVPVFWPILVMYFITLFAITMNRQIKVGADKTRIRHSPTDFVPDNRRRRRQVCSVINASPPATPVRTECSPPAAVGFCVVYPPKP